jgi:hypothetical protein
MLLRVTALLFACAVALSGPAVASAQPDAVTEEAALDARAWRIYRDASTALAEGRRDEAREGFRRLGVEHPGHPAAEAAAQALAAVESAPVAVPSPAASVAPSPLDETVAPEEETPRPLATPRARRAGRAALVTFQTFAGMWAGSLLGTSIRGTPLSVSLGFGLGLAGGLTLSLLFSRHAEPGQSLAVNVGTFWGISFGLLAAGILGTEPDPTDMSTEGDRRALEEVPIVAPMLIGQAVGTAAGALAAALLRPEAGDVVFANSLGVWALSLYGAAYFARDEAEQSMKDEWRRPWLAGWLDVTGVALACGILLSRFLPPDFSAARAQLVNLTGIAGLVVGGGPFLIWALVAERFVPAGVALPIAGAMAGLGLGWYLTRNHDRETRANVALGPAPAGLGPGLVVSLR